MLVHGFTPDYIRRSVIVPIPKNANGDLCSNDNYRGISLCSAITKVFEVINYQQFDPFMKTSELQFAFKANHSTTMSDTVLKEVIKYYNNRGSDVFCCMVDATKAFDRLKFGKIFHILLNKNLQISMERILYDMYTHQNIKVRWMNCTSESFTATNGVRQGGIISPVLFNLYLDVLLNSLKNSLTGCYIGHMYAGCLAYADDVTLLSPTVKGLQHMLNLCELFGEEYGVQYNAKKTVCIRFGSKTGCFSQHPRISLCGSILEWKNVVKYLGIYVSSDLNDCDDIDFKCRVFYRSVNYLYVNFGKMPSEIINDLFNAYCCSFYGSQCWNLKSKSLQRLSIAYNKALRRVWKVPPNAHRHIIYGLCGRTSLISQLECRFHNLLINMVECENALINFIASFAVLDFSGMLGANIAYLMDKYKLTANKIYEKNVIRNNLLECRFSEKDKCTIQVIKETISVRDDLSVQSVISHTEAQLLIDELSSDRYQNNNIIICLTT